MEHTSKKGLITALSCYIIWGLLPLYWALLNHVSPYNILAQRIIWSGICMAIVVFGLQTIQKGLSITKRTTFTTIPTFSCGSHHQCKLVHLHLGHRQ